jgi:hypothetical protein
MGERIFDIYLFLIEILYVVYFFILLILTCSHTYYLT